MPDTRIQRFLDTGCRQPGCPMPSRFEDEHREQRSPLFGPRLASQWQPRAGGSWSSDVECAAQPLQQRLATRATLSIPRHTVPSRRDTDCPPPLHP